MERENAKKLPSSVWKYSFVIAMTLIIGYIVLVGILLIPILTGNSNHNSSNKDALETIKTITTVFGPWIAALVAFYFAGKQLENVSNQLGEAQKTITSVIKPDFKRVLEGKFVKDIMEPYDASKHKIPLDSSSVLDDAAKETIKQYTEKSKDTKCFAVFKKDGNVEGIITPTDIKEIQKLPSGQKEKKLEDFTTDIIRLVKAAQTQTIVDILPGLISFKVLPVFEGENIIGFVHRDAVFKIMSKVS